MNPRLKQIIYNKLYKDLSHVEIIPHKDSIWFIDRKEKYWYLVYKKNGTLYWRWQFFPNFFNLFSLKQNEFEPIISEWVEEVLNCKVNTPMVMPGIGNNGVEEVLNCKVNTPFIGSILHVLQVEEVLNCKVVTPCSYCPPLVYRVEEVLNCKVNTPIFITADTLYSVEQVLNVK